MDIPRQCPRQVLSTDSVLTFVPSGADRLGQGAVTPAMEAGITYHAWSLEEIVALLGN
jgi:hypothetical protein